MLIGQPRIGAIGQAEGVVAAGVRQRIDPELRHGRDVAGKHRCRCGTDQLGRGAEQRLLIEEDGLWARLRIEILHAMVEIGVLQPRAGTVHGAGWRGRNIDDRWFRREQARAVRGLALRILGHDLERVAGLRHENRHHARRDHDAAAADRDQHVSPGGGRGLLCRVHRDVGRNPSRCRHRRRRNGRRARLRCAGLCRSAG